MPAGMPTSHLASRLGEVAGYEGWTGEDTRPGGEPEGWNYLPEWLFNRYSRKMSP